MSSHKIDLSGVSMFDVHPDDPAWSDHPDHAAYLADLPKATVSVSGFFGDGIAAPAQPVWVPVGYIWKRHAQPLRAVALFDEATYEFKLTGHDVQRLARYMSPTWRARVCRIHSEYRRRQRRRT